MALAVDIMPGHGSNSKMHPQLQPKKTKVRLYYIAIDIARGSASVLKVGVSYGWQSILKNWFLVLW